MFDLDRRPILWTIGHRLRSNIYIPVYHTNRRPIKNTIGLVKNRLVGMALNRLHTYDYAGITDIGYVPKGYICIYIICIMA